MMLHIHEMLECPSVHEQLLKKSSPLKLPNRFQGNFTEMILG